MRLNVKTHRKRTGEQVKTTALLVLPAGDTGDEVHPGRRDQLGLEPELVPKVQAEEYWDRQIVGDEGRGVPTTVEENAPVGEQDDDGRPRRTPPSRVWHELAVPRQVLVADTLRLQALSESNSCNTDTEPVEHSGDGAHVGEPAENGVRGFGDGQIGDGTESGGKDQGVDGGSLGVGAGEDLGGLTDFGETV
jgi:hypothetical protein